MLKSIKILGLAALLAVMGGVFAGCETSPEEPKD